MGILTNQTAELSILASHKHSIKAPTKVRSLYNNMGEKKFADLKSQVLLFKNINNSEQTATMWKDFFFFFFTVIKCNLSEYKVLIECQ